MPERKVLTPFPYAADHIHVEDLSEGDMRDFPADILPGLEAAGYVEAKAIRSAPENKAVLGAPENKDAGKPVQADPAPLALDEPPADQLAPQPAAAQPRAKSKAKRKRA